MELMGSKGLSGQNDMRGWEGWAGCAGTRAPEPGGHLCLTSQGKAPRNGPRAAPHCSPNGHDDPQEGLQEHQELGRGAGCPPQGQQLVLVNGLELLPLDQGAPIAADPPAVVPGAHVQGGV